MNRTHPGGEAGQRPTSQCGLLRSQLRAPAVFRPANVHRRNESGAKVTALQDAAARAGGKWFAQSSVRNRRPGNEPSAQRTARTTLGAIRGQYRPFAANHSTFCTCSRIFSNSVFASTTRWAMPASLAFDPIVLNSRKNSCSRKSRLRPDGLPLSIVSQNFFT